MQIQEFFTHYPSRLLSVGVAGLSFFSVLMGASLLPILDQPNFPYSSRRAPRIESIQPLSSLLPGDLQSHELPFDLSSIEDRFLLSLCPARPDGSFSSPIAHIKIRGSNQNRQLLLPGKIGLLFNDQQELSFQEEKDQFWMELSLSENGSLFSSIAIDCEGEMQKAFFSRQPAEPLIQKAEELPCEEPFRSLSQMRWMGPDLICLLGEGRIEQKLEIGSSKLNISEKAWIFWDGNRWMKALSAEEGKGRPLAKIHTASAQNLEWDAWDGKGEFHIRFAVPHQTAGAGRIKIEECFSSIRIRSDKQVSCLLEKQCLILREGDWILKENNRWRVLRKPEEKLHLIQGKRSGDLIVLDAIDMKRKAIQGQFIFSNRVQGFPIELMATSSKLERKMASGPSERAARLGRIP